MDNQPKRGELEALRSIVKGQYPEARTVATSRQIWIQSSWNGLAISRAVSFQAQGENAEYLAWQSAVNTVQAERRAA